MADIERAELKRQFEQIIEFIDGTEMEAHLLEENPAVPALSLLMGLPGEVEEGHYIVCNLMPLSEEESAYTNFLQMFYKIPYEVGDLDEMTLLKAVNAMNASMVTGSFMYTKMPEHKARIQYSAVLTFDVEEDLNPSTICECACLLLRYASVMEEFVTGIAGGMKLADIFKAEGMEEEEW